MSRPITRKEFGMAYEKGCSQTVNFLISRGLQEEEANEKAQAAWAKGWERRFQMRDKKKALAWINTIALNLYRSSYRRDSRFEIIHEFPVPARIKVHNLDLYKRLDQCREIDREILKLRYFEGFEIRELADRYDCTETAIRVRLLRARRSLKAKYTS
jgi:RNA polymerase sigma-70 factor (ECF subfamily)